MNLDKWVNKVTAGHVLDVLQEMPDNSIDCCITSPPYFGLRSYNSTPQVWDADPNCSHEWGDAKSKLLNLQAGNPEFQRNWREKATSEVTNGSFCIHCQSWRGELGLEPDFRLYVSHLVQIFREVRRVLKKTGSCWVNLGDSFASSPVGSLMGIPAKSLIGIPERFAIAMTDELGLIRRNSIIWHKPSAMPSSASDRFTCDFEYFYFFTKQGNYYFEQQFEPQTERGDGDLVGGNKYQGINKNNFIPYTRNPLGRNQRTVWSINPEPSSEPHYAQFPKKLVETPIRACCPEFICTNCGKAREKVYCKSGGTTGYSWHDHTNDLEKGMLGRGGIPKGDTP